MTDNARKVFDMLGVEPGEKFKLKEYGKFIYKIDEDLNIYYKPKSSWEITNMNVGWFLTGEEEIVKIPKKKQVKYLTEDDVKEICDKSLGCVNCPFHYLTFEANATVITCFKEDLIDYIKASHHLPKFFLNSEVEIPEEAK